MTHYEYNQALKVISKKKLAAQKEILEKQKLFGSLQFMDMLGAWI
jgi:hypothetical protein